MSTVRAWEEGVEIWHMDPAPLGTNGLVCLPNQTNAHKAETPLSSQLQHWLLGHGCVRRQRLLHLCPKLPLAHQTRRAMPSHLQHWPLGQGSVGLHLSGAVSTSPLPEVVPPWGPGAPRGPEATAFPPEALPGTAPEEPGPAPRAACALCCRRRRKCERAREKDRGRGRGREGERERERGLGPLP